MDLDQLNKVHPSRQANVDRWNFLYRSYIGGDEYRKGSYLHKYYGEDQAPFNAYARRLEATPLDNHVKTTVDIYRSYIWQKPPARNFRTLAKNPFIENFMWNCDQEGQTLDSWLKNALDWSMVFGTVWVLVDKPSHESVSAAEELVNDIRPYLKMYTPQNVLDWECGKLPNGGRELTYVKTLEKSGDGYALIRCWYPEVVLTYKVKVDANEITAVDDVIDQANQLGRVPFITLTPQKVPGLQVGPSMLGDVADIQRSIYNKLSELEQNIRISNHPTLVKTFEAQANAGAGSIINIPDNTDGGLKPYLLQPSGASIDGILKAIEHDIDSINSITHLTAVRVQKGAMSGVALETERQLLNAKLCDLSDTVRECENKIWTLWSEWMELPDVITVEYSTHFDTRDPQRELGLIEKGMSLVEDEDYTKWAKQQIIKLTVRDEEEQQRLLSVINKTIINE